MILMASSILSLSLGSNRSYRAREKLKGHATRACGSSVPSARSRENRGNPAASSIFRARSSFNRLRFFPFESKRDM